MAQILLKTAVPGPKSIEWGKRRASAVTRGVSAATPVFVEFAENSTLVDVDGNRFLDFAGGIGCMNVGHRNAAVTSAMLRQTEAYLHVCFQVTGYEPYIVLAEKLNTLVPGKFAKKTLLANSGAEGVENAIKIARAYTGRSGVICFTEAFHGRTMLGLGLTSKTHPYKTGFAPFVPELYRLPFGACPKAGVPSRSKADYVSMFEDAFHRVVSAEEVAAIVLEPVQGEGGFNVAEPTFLEAVADVCHRYGIVFVLDEVQTGFGRTGKLFAAEHFDVEPDVLVTAKSLGGGMPIAAVTGRAEIMDAPGPGGLGGTFSGNPVACAAALAVIAEFEDGTLLAQANALGEKFAARATAWKMKYLGIADVRGLGAMRAIEFRTAAGAPDAAKAKAVAQGCLERGVIILLAGVDSNVVRVLMPLVMTEEELDEGMDVMEAVLQAIA